MMVNGYRNINKNYAKMLGDINFPWRKLSFCILLLVIYSTSQGFITLVQEDSTTTDAISMSESDLDKNITLKEFFSVVPISSTNVFLITPLKNPRILFRYLCAAESWAFHHPNAKIWYTLTVTEIEDPGGFIKKLLKEYSNIRFIYSDIEKLMVDTPLHNSTFLQAWKSSKWQGTHMSDFMRQAVLWHRGGYYSDTDVYVVKNLNKNRNFISTAKNVYDACFIHNDYHHPWNKAFLESIARTYNPKKYFSAALTAGMDTAVRECGDTYGKDAGKIIRNCTLHGQMQTIQHWPYLFSPFGQALVPKNTKLYEDSLKAGAHAFHLSNSASRRFPDKFGSESILDNLAKRSCPLIYNTVQKYTDFW